MTQVTKRERDDALARLSAACLGLPEDTRAESISWDDKADLCRQAGLTTRAVKVQGQPKGTTSGMPDVVGRYQTVRYGWLEYFLLSDLRVGDVHDGLHVVSENHRIGDPWFPAYQTIILIDGSSVDEIALAANAINAERTRRGVALADEVESRDSAFAAQLRARAAGRL